MMSACEGQRLNILLYFDKTFSLGINLHGSAIRPVVGDPL
jgi:hypothetical protein